MKRRTAPGARLAIAVAVSAATIAGCGGAYKASRTACFEADAYLTGLAKAPGEVRLTNGSPISDCLTKEPATKLAKVGRAMIAAATKLKAETSANLGGVATIRLGYLIGSAWRGGEARIYGMPSKLLHRLTKIAERRVGRRPLPIRFRVAYLTGFDAAFRHYPHPSYY